MSLLDDVSIVVTPNGYKAGTLFGAIPVPTFGSDVITDGGFPLPNVNWSLGGGWSVGSDVATHNGNTNSNISQSIPLTVGTAYSVTYTVVDASVGSRIGISTNATSIEIERTTDGTYTETFTATLSSFYIRSLWNNGSPVSVDNVSVKEWVGADMDVTRATAATRVDENGLVNYAEVLGGEEVPSIASIVNVGGGTITQISGNSYSSTSDGTSGSAVRPKFDFNTTAGKRYKLTITPTGTISGTINFDFYDGSSYLFQNYDFTTTKEIYFTDNGTVFGAFDGTQNYDVSSFTVSIKEEIRDNVPRIDYTGGGCPHILAEPMRTNVNTDSQDFSKSFYIKDSGVSVGDTNFVSPSGESNATQIEVNNNGRIYANVASDTYASSVFIKAGTFAYFKFGGNVDLVAGTFSGGTIESFGNGWFKITKQYTGNRPFQIQAYPDGTYSSHTTYGNYYIWGSQIEEGSYATSYIPTSGSTVTRNQDIFTRDGIGSLINSTEGVLFAEIAALATINNAADAISIGDGTIANQIAMWYSNATNQFKVLIRQSGNKLFAILTLTDAKAFIKVAISYKSGDMKVYINGVSVATSVSPFAFTAPLTLLDLGATGLGNFNGKVKQLQVYDTALTDDQLRQLTQ